MRTHTIVVLDSSGSMQPIANDTIGGYNRYLQEQQSAALEGDTWTLITFESASHVQLAAVPLQAAPFLTPESYRPGGNTALLDAVGDALKQDRPAWAADDRVLCVVQTDGEENCSSHTTLDELRELVTAKEASGYWTFVFLGAGIDAFATGAGIGSAAAQANSLSYAASPAASQVAWRTTSRASMAFRRQQNRSAASFYSEADRASVEEPDNSTT